MHSEETVQVVINLTRTAHGMYHWFVTTSQELQTVQWADDGSIDDLTQAVAQAISTANNELVHVMRGGSVELGGRA